jgi:hypothetical protein
MAAARAPPLSPLELSEDELVVPGGGALDVPPLGGGDGPASEAESVSAARERQYGEQVNACAQACACTNTHKHAQTCTDSFHFRSKLLGGCRAKHTNIQI